MGGLPGERHHGTLERSDEREVPTLRDRLPPDLRDAPAARPKWSSSATATK